MSRKDPVFLRDAENDLEEAVEHYEKEKKGLGIEFIDEVSKKIEEINLMPSRFSKVGKVGKNEVRRAFVDRFPYRIFFSLVKDVVKILRVLHSKRNTNDFKS